MTRKTFLSLFFLILFSALVVISGIIILALANTRPPRVTRAKFEMIQMGMSIVEVEQIMGMPQHDRLEPENYDWPNPIDFNLPTAVFADEYAMIIVSANEELGVYAKKYGTRHRDWLDYVPGFSDGNSRFSGAARIGRGLQPLEVSLTAVPLKTVAVDE